MTESINKAAVEALNNQVKNLRSKLEFVQADITEYQNRIVGLEKEAEELKTAISDIISAIEKLEE